MEPRDTFFSLISCGDLDAIKNGADSFYSLPHNKQLTEDGKTPLHFVKVCSSALYQFLCQNGKHQLNTKDSAGDSPLHIATQCNNAEAVKLLIKYGADIDTTNNDNMTPLHFISLIGSVEIAELLLDHNATLNAFDHKGQTPLHIATLKRHEKLTKLYIRRNADPNIRTKEGLTAMHVALKQDDFDFITLFVNHGADVSLLYDQKENTNLAKHFEEDNPKGNDDIFGFFATQEQPHATENIDGKSVVKFDDRLKKYSGTKKDPHSQQRQKKILKELLKGALPNSRRTQWWRICMGDSDMKKFSIEYESMLQIEFDLKEACQIDKDINRCLRFHKMFSTRYGEGQCKLYRVLRAYATQDRETKYTQGMSTLAAILLIYFQSEAEAYGAMRVLFHKYKLHDWYANNLIGLTEAFPIFEKLASQHIPQVHNHLVTHISKVMNIENYSSLFFTNWILECYFSSLPHSLSLKCWDIFLFIGPSFLFAMGLSILAELQKELLGASDMGKIISQLKNTETKVWDEEGVLRRALRFGIRNSQIQSKPLNNSKKKT